MPSYSKLAIPAEDILSKFTVHKEGFKLPSIESLLCLKFSAFLDRKMSIKGQKDAIDLLGLMSYPGIDMRKLHEVSSAYGLNGMGREMLALLRAFDSESLKYLNLNPKSFSGLRHRLEPEIKKHLP